MYAPESAGQDEDASFGVSGKLWNGVLVMYDRATGSLWTAVDGRALEGERATHGAGRNIENRKKSVSRILLIAAAELREATMEQTVMARDDFGVGGVAEAPFQVGRTHQIGEQEDLENRCGWAGRSAHRSPNPGRPTFGHRQVS